MTLNLVADRTVKGRIYPALAMHEARPYTQSWREFEQHWPCTVPFRLQEYCDAHCVPLNIYSVDNFPANSFYPIGLGFFDFSIDYFALLPQAVFDNVFDNKLKILFYYHEGDNPFHIKSRLDELCAKHGLREDCYKFVSGNSAAESIPGFIYFTDFELWYYQRNHGIEPLRAHPYRRQKEFTALNRLHKSWRATGMTDLRRHGLLDRSFWSYCETGPLTDADNPIAIDCFEGLRADTEQFLRYAPYVADELTNEQRNDHSNIEAKYYIDSYCNIVFETHFDADGCHGTFLTEKTFKPIKHGQLFFVAGPAGSLDVLRDLGYRVFDNILDNSYDTNVSNTGRWQQLKKAIADARPYLPELFERALPDIEYNQQLFVANKAQRLNSLLRKINDNR